MPSNNALYKWYLNKVMPCWNFEFLRDTPFLLIPSCASLLPNAPSLGGLTKIFNIPRKKETNSLNPRCLDEWKKITHH